jgi:hypothetical protein
MNSMDMMMREPDFLPSYRSYRNEGERPKALTLKQAAGIAGVSPDTVARWCKRHGIGKHLHPKAPWRVDPIGLAIVMAGDPVALAEYRNS